MVAVRKDFLGLILGVLVWILDREGNEVKNRTTPRGRMERAAKAEAYRVMPGEPWGQGVRNALEKSLLRFSQRERTRALREALKIVPHCGERPRCAANDSVDQPDHYSCALNEKIRALTRNTSGGRKC